MKTKFCTKLLTLETLLDEISNLIFFLVASFDKISLKMEIVEILSDLNSASPRLYFLSNTWLVDRELVIFI